MYAILDAIPNGLFGFIVAFTVFLFVWFRLTLIISNGVSRTFNNNFTELQTRLTEIKSVLERIQGDTHELTTNESKTSYKFSSSVFSDLDIRQQNTSFAQPLFDELEQLSKKIEALNK